MDQFTNKELAAEARREVGMRRRVYNRWVEQRREGWTRERADRGIAMMEAIAEKLDALAQADADLAAPRLDL